MPKGLNTELIAHPVAASGEDLDRLSDAALAEDALELQQLLDRLAGQWLRRLAAVDARGAAGADQGEPAPSTAGWLRNRLRMGAGAAHEAVRTARALFRGPLTATADALVSGQLSAAHARVLAQGTRQLPDHLTADAEPVLVEAAARLDPPRLRQAVGYLLAVADPEGADAARQRRHERRGLWLAPTLDGMVAVDGLLEPEAGHTVLAALEPVARPAAADDGRSSDQRNADALTELARRSLEGGWLPKAGGVRPQLLVTVDLDSLLGRPEGLGGDLGWAGSLEAEACRRLACDGAVTRVVVTRHPDGHQSLTDQPPPGSGSGADFDSATDHGLSDPDRPGIPHPSADDGLQRWLRAAMAGCPRPWVGRPASPSMWAGRPGSCHRPSAAPWRCGTGAVCSRVVIARWPGVTLIICGTGSMVARPICGTWPWSAEPITGPSMRGAGS